METVRPEGIHGVIQKSRQKVDQRWFNTENPASRLRQVRDSRPGRSAGRTGCHFPPELWSAALNAGSGHCHPPLHDSASTSSCRDFQCWKDDIYNKDSWISLGRHRPRGDKTVVISSRVVLGGWESHVSLGVNTVVQQPRTHRSNLGKMSVISARTQTN